MKTCPKNVPALFAFCLAILLAPAFASAAQKPLAQEQAKAHPTLQVRDPDYNFGDAVQGETIEHAFTLKNTGGKTLRIEHVKVA